jgi:hypothetical protein
MKSGMLARAALISAPAQFAVPTMVWAITTCGRPVHMVTPWAMLTATNSCGTVIGLGRSLPSATNFAKASTSGPKSVPALPKKYSMPRARSSSR